MACTNADVACTPRSSGGIFLEILGVWAFPVTAKPRLVRLRSLVTENGLRHRGPRRCDSPRKGSSMKHVAVTLSTTAVAFCSLASAQPLGGKPVTVNIEAQPVVG